MRYRAVIFDKDGVLINSFETVYSAMNKALTHYDYDSLAREEFRKEWWGIRADDNIERKLRISRERALEIFDLYKQKRKELDQMTKLYPNVKTVLSRLDGDYGMGVVTSTNREIAIKLLEDFEIFGFFDVIVGGDETTPKPAPDALLKACNELGVEPEETIFIGDTDADIGAGQSAGCTTVIVTTSKTRDELDKVEGIIVIDDLEDILELVGS
jgi:HAD superfamily hydrolase (TIGR01509 family)